LGAKPIEISGRLIGTGQPVFLVAEVGVTCNGDIATALKLIDAAKEAGADSVKFQMINPNEFMSDKSVMYEYETTSGKRSENMYEMLKGLRLGFTDWNIISDYCRKKGIIFYNSVDSIGDVIMGDRLIPCWKISSWDLRNHPLLKKVARTGKPIQIDLGPAILGEVVQLIDTFHREGNDKLIFLHCSHASDANQLNMRTIQYLQEEFGILCGYSSDGRDCEADKIAVCAGACLIEKRLTLNVDQKQHHHAKALNPDEFKEWVGVMRQFEAIMGDYAIKPSIEDIAMKNDYFTSLVFNCDVKKGEVITENHLCAKRPGSGMSPFYSYLLVGRVANRDFSENEIIDYEMVKCLTFGGGA